MLQQTRSCWLKLNSGSNTYIEGQFIFGKASSGKSTRLTAGSSLSDWLADCFQGEFMSLSVLLPARRVLWALWLVVMPQKRLVAGLFFPPLRIFLQAADTMM